jgi:hypothetical protein
VNRGPWDPAEFAKALARPPAYRTPPPSAGDRVFFRMEPFGPLTEAQVIDVQDLDDRSDHYLWHVVRDPDTGAALKDALGDYLMERVPDPWPVVTLSTDWGRLTTREGRVRGSQGWWPLDWERRFYPTPGGAGWARAIDERLPT